MKKYDCIIALGNPATKSGKPGAIMQTRVRKAVELYKEGVSDKIIFTGAAVKNEFNEAQVMSELAETFGAPSDAIVKEHNANDSIENAQLAVDIMKKNNWKKAVVVTNKYHVKRMTYIFSKYDIHFDVVAADYPGNFPTLLKIIYNLYENWLTLRISTFGNKKLPN